jgi:hypothetical protein
LAVTRLFAVVAAGGGCASLGFAAYLFALLRHPSADPHGGVLIFLPALFLSFLGAVLSLVGITVWRRKHGWQLFMTIGVVLGLLIALVALGAI